MSMTKLDGAKNRLRRAEGRLDSAIKALLRPCEHYHVNYYKEEIIIQNIKIDLIQEEINQLSVKAIPIPLVGVWNGTSILI